MELDSEFIIIEVGKYPVLYNAEDEHYKDRNAKIEAWKKVTEAAVGELYQTLDEKQQNDIGKEVQKRWKTIKDAYLRSLKTQSLKSGSGTFKRKRYVYHHQMSFLLPTIQNRRTTGQENTNTESNYDNLQVTEEGQPPAVMWRASCSKEEFETRSCKNVECSKRMAYIRDSYIRRSDLLSFLDNCSSSKRSTITNISGTEDESVDDIGTEETDAPENEIEDNIQNAIDNVKYEILLEEDEGENTCNTGIKTEDNTWSFKKRKAPSSSEEQLKFHQEIAEEKRQPLLNVSDEKDETDLFFASMAKIVKKLPECERAQLRMQIGTLIGNAELNYLLSNKIYKLPTSAATSSTDT